MMQEKIKFYASLARPFVHSYSPLCVRLEPADYILWHKKLQDEVESYIEIDEFIRRFPNEWQYLSEEWHRQFEAGVPENAIVAEVELPANIVTENDPNLVLMPVSQADDHRAFLKVLTAISEGYWETEDGRILELDSEESPFRQMGMI